MALEDTLYAGALAALAEGEQIGSAADDGSRIHRDLWRAYAEEYPQRINYIQQSEHYTRLLRAGFESAVPYCMSLDTTPIVARLEGDRLRAL